MSTIPFNDENLAKIREAAAHLQGSCHSLEDGLQMFFGDDADITDFDILLLQELDDITMMCEGCNWWCETGELDDDQLCGDCQ